MEERERMDFIPSSATLDVLLKKTINILFFSTNLVYWKTVYSMRPTPQNNQFPEQLLLSLSLLILHLQQIIFIRKLPPT